jgi:hypothetical protein
VLVLDEPSVAFYLGAEGISARERVGALELGRALQASPQPVWVVVGYYSRHVPADQHALDALKDQLKPLATVPFSVGDLRLLDDHPAKVARRLRGVSADEYALQLFRSTP